MSYSQDVWLKNRERRSHKYTHDFQLFRKRTNQEGCKIEGCRRHGSQVTAEEGHGSQVNCGLSGKAWCFQDKLKDAEDIVCRKTEGYRKHGY